MFYIKTLLNKSNIHGIGLFTSEEIKKDQRIYNTKNSLNHKLSQESFEKLSEYEKSIIMHYGFFDKRDCFWKLACDDIRFLNHGSSNANLYLSNDILYASRDIKENEELLQNYSDFEEEKEKQRLFY